MLYHEDGMILEVEILNDKSDESWERYELKVIKNVQENGLNEPAEVGEIFTCEKRRGEICCGLWHLN